VRHQVVPSISVETIRAIPAEAHASFQRTRSRKRSTDPQLEAKATRVPSGGHFAANLQQIRDLAAHGRLAVDFPMSQEGPECLMFKFKSWWRRRMGVEPTLEQEAARATVLKTARPTGTRPPPRAGEV
jgi:hypothetical protein